MELMVSIHIAPNLQRTLVYEVAKLTLGDTGGLSACLREPAHANQRASYQIFAITKGFVGGIDCIKLDGLQVIPLPDETPIGVWQYT